MLTENELVTLIEKELSTRFKHCKSVIVETALPANWLIEKTKEEYEELGWNVHVTLLRDRMTWEFSFNKQKGAMPKL